MITPFTALAFLSGLASAIPSTLLTPRGESPTFQLLFAANGNDDIPDTVAPLRTGIWALGGQDGNAVLFPSRTQASLFYAYSPSFSIATASVGIMIFPGGTATIPNGAPVELVVNNATTNVKIVPNEAGVPLLWYNDGAFQACAGQDDEIFLSYIAPGQRRLADCAAVDLIAACSGTGNGQEMVGQLGKPFNVACQPH